MSLITNAEKLAEKAENLNAFSGLKLLHIRNQIKLILNQIGRDGIFDEYTKHDISHIDYMLESLDWIIPKKTQEILTPSDWLMIVLSIYLHDLGMLVTKEEFNKREKSMFPSFKEEILEGIYGLDYKEKILSIEDSNNQDRFIYQELIRKTHAERIKYWILDEPHPNFTMNLSIVDEIRSLLSPLDNMFRRDLALICESHHLNDLDDFEKYKVNQQYGASQKEIVNLQYAAIILRTADLLHITSDRTPSIEYRLINPTDPISQDEWAKQRAVKAIRPQPKKNKDGAIDDKIEKDTLEVIALFEDEKGFFGLISYINYADSQLQENFRFNELSKKNYSTNHEYPWKSIDDSSIQAENFEKKQFEFTIDQRKILDLLVGHTLYNDSTVVLRELTQNSIDACKLKKYELNNNSYIPSIEINWEEKNRDLSFIDNGTGMTLEIIENFLLKVGSSRYQDENFKKKHPNFFSISRFGIGLLTCFLIADNLDIITKHSDNEKSILLKINKVHGKYLLKYLSKEKTPDEIKEHGTIIRLSVRSEVDLNNIQENLQKWILFPNCNMSLKTNQDSIKIGYQTPKEYLEHHLATNGYILDNNIKVQEVYRNGITIAYALKYIEHWNEWVFLETNDFDNILLGTCIEGIRVDFKTPGFNGNRFYSIVNTTGKNAPKTNVARSNIESTPESENLLYTIYELYLEHIANELQSIRDKGFSITWAADESHYLLKMFINDSKSYNKTIIKLQNEKIFEKALLEFKNILVEKNEERKLISLKDIYSLNSFWTIDSASYKSANSLIKEIKSSNSSAIKLLKTIFSNNNSNTEHIDTLLCNFNPNNTTEKLLKSNFQVDTIKIIREQRRLDFKWSKNERKKWEGIKLSEDNYNSGMCYIQIDDSVELIDINDEIAVFSGSNLFLFKNSELNTFLTKLINELTNNKEDKLILTQIISLINSLFYFKPMEKIEEYIESRFRQNKNRDLTNLIWSKVNKDEFFNIILKTSFKYYDPNIWHRRDIFMI